MSPDRTRSADLLLREVPDVSASSSSPVCPDCGTEIAPHLLACPACGALVHARELKALADDAARASSPREALVSWRQVYALLPAGSRQQQAVAAKIEELVRAAEGTAQEPAAGKGGTWGKVSAGAGVVAVLLAKFKFVLIFALTKAKFLLLGLTKMGTLLSMFLSFGVYWAAWGWKFAAGVVLSIYVHEMGHVAMLRRLGVRCSAPMFIPGLGALIRLRENLPTAREDARVGLAGPIWGLGAALFAWVLAVTLDSPMCAAIAGVGAWINLFNLAPIWQLDGSRAWRALTKRQRWIATAVVVIAFILAAEEARASLLIVLIFCIIRLFRKDSAPTPDHRALAEYVVLIAALTVIATVVAGP